jgi:hypothetical protein
VVDRLRLAFGRTAAGVDYQGIDNLPVHFLFLIVAPPPEVSNQYLPVLGKIAQFVKEEDVPERTAAGPVAEEFLALLDEKGCRADLVERPLQEGTAQENAGDGEVNDQTVTSTNVATNGAEALAGSHPTRRKRKGSIEPAKVPKVTTPTRLRPTVMATRR